MGAGISRTALSRGSEEQLRAETEDANSQAACGSHNLDTVLFTGLQTLPRGLSMKPSEQPTCKPPISPCTLQAPVGDPLQALANDVCVGPAQRTIEAYRDLESRNGCQRLTGLSELYSLETSRYCSRGHEQEALSTQLGFGGSREDTQC